MNNAAEKVSDLMTVEEFLRWPGDGSGRIAELVDGVVRLQDPASDTHNTIFGNLHATIHNHVHARHPQCRVVPTAGIQPRLRKRRNWRVPEIAVTCVPNQKGVHATEGAVLIVEVLSRHNRKDTWDNVPLYASVPTVQEMLLVESERVEAHLLRRQPDGSWPEEPEAISDGGVIHLSSIGLELPLSEVYRNTHLATPA